MLSGSSSNVVEGGAADHPPHPAGGGGRAADSRRLVAALLPSIGTGTVHEVNNKFNFNVFEFRRHRKTTKC